MLNARNIVAACLLALLVSVGCLKGESGKPDQSPPPPEKFTGAIIYTRPGCMPCEFLKNDVAWLIAHHGWKRTDFKFQTATDGGPVPETVFYKSGNVVGRIKGYSQGTQAERRPLLLEICRNHPLRKR